tara:strand:+ start:2059 stop:3348 length:1290 start_codon:yes stop_codon:yes gene_type:complete
MANISFGLDTNKYAQQTGFDQFQTGMFETLGEIAKDAWKYNPVSSAFRLSELEINRGRIDNEPLIDRQKLNDEYGKYNLIFEEDEKQSTVDILVARKKSEIERQSIIQRGPQGFLPATAKLATSLVTSIADPINLAMMFIPIVGEARFAAMVARAGLTGARFRKGAMEGLVGIAAIEPLVYTAATREQSDYDLVDSLIAVTFGGVLGGGLHVGVGKLKDFNTRRKFYKKIKIAREKAGITDGEDPGFSLYREYYPENSRIMKELAETNPDVRRTLLAKALADLGEDIDVNVKDVADLDPKLRNAQINEKVSPNETVNPKNQVDEDINFKRQEITSEDTAASRTKNSLEQKAQDEYEASNAKEDIELRNLDEEVSTVESQLVILKDRQKDLGIKDNDDVKLTTKEAEEFKTKEKEIKDAIIDGINCFNGR